MATPFDTHRTQVSPRRSITEGQAAYLRDLMTTKAQLKGMDVAAAVESVEAWLLTLSREGASAQIEKQKAAVAELMATLPAAPHARNTDLPNAETVPAGGYAVDTEDGATNSLAFYRVDRPTEGRWAGYVFVKLITGGDEQRLSRATSNTVLAKIAAAGAEAAASRYGHEIGRCGLCDRQLTNDESRARGIGPVCVNKMGW